MSLKTLPLLFINLGGEMMYILDQRLRAQNIAEEKARKVLHDIIGTMFNRRFMDELFKPQDLYSKKAMRTVFDRLAHASIMRLNNASMDKLYDLMTMAFKYQVSLCVRPTDVILVTLNHLDALRSFVSEDSAITQQVEHVYKLLLQHYASLSPGEFMLVRQTLLNFFQDMHIRVSIFLKDKVQNTNGRFVLPTSGPVPFGSDIPGSIRLFNSNGEMVRTREFQAGGKFVNSEREGSMELHGNRVIKLGTNMYNVKMKVKPRYSMSRPLEATVSGHSKTITSSVAEASAPNPLARAQLDLLSHLIGSGDKKPSKSEFRLNLFNNDEDERQAEFLTQSDEPDSQIINIDASKKKGSAELNRIMGELKVSDGSGSADQGDDLLDLMDSAQ